jgi:chromosome segregation ATPase
MSTTTTTTDPVVPQPSTRSQFSPADEKLHAETEKLRAEVEKVRAEIEDIRKPFYQTSGFYTAVSPIVLALLGVIFSWWSGWFDTQAKSIETKNDLLQVQTANLEREKQEQQSHLSDLTNQIVSLQTQTNELGTLRFTLTNQITSLEKDKSELEDANRILSEKTTRLAGSDTIASNLVVSLDAIRKERSDVQLELASLRRELGSFQEDTKKRFETIAKDATAIEASAHKVAGSANIAGLKSKITAIEKSADRLKDYAKTAATNNVLDSPIVVEPSDAGRH